MVKTESFQKLKTNEIAPNFSLKGVDNKEYSLKEVNASATLIVFMCNHCPYVKARIGDMVALQSKFDYSDFQIIGINSNDPSYEGEGFDNMVQFSKDYSLNFPYLFDDSQVVAREYGAVCTPDPFLLNKSKKLIYHGKINDATEPDKKPSRHIMEENIKKIIDGKEDTIEKNFDPSIGCSIKWKG